MPSRTAVVGAAAVLPVLLAASLAGCRVDPELPNGQTRQVEYRVTEPVTTLKATALAGRIEVVGADVTDIAVTEHLRYHGTEPVTRHRVVGKTLVLDYTCPEGTDDCWVSYHVRVPRGTAVDLHSDAGEVRMSELAGGVKADTTAGVIMGSKLRSQRVQVNSAAGTVSLTFDAAPADVEARATAGSVTVKVPGDQRYAVNARTDAGSTRVSVPEDDTSPHRIKVSSAAGALSVLGS